MAKTVLFLPLLPQFQFDLLRVDFYFTMWMNLFRIYILSCGILIVATENYTKCSEIDLNLVKNTFLFKYTSECGENSTVFTLEGEMRHYNTNCAHKISQDTMKKCSLSNPESIKCNEIRKNKLFFIKCIAPHIDKVVLKDIKRKHEKKNTFLTELRNLMQLEWHLRSGCSDIKEMISNFKNLYKLTIHFYNYLDLKSCGHFDNIGPNVLKELYIYVEGVTHPFSLTNTLLKDVRGLKIFDINCGLNNRHGIHIQEETFKNLRNLTKLVIENCGDIFLTPDDFQDLSNLKSLHLKNIFLYDLKWMGSKALQNSLEYLELTSLPDAQHRGSLERLLDLKKLKIIETSSLLIKFGREFNVDTQAFICFQDTTICKFQFDANNRRCPNDCRCTLDRPMMNFRIECDGSVVLSEIPELPIPMIGSTSLYMNKANITKLPKSNLYGYSKVKELHLASNKLQHLTVDQLPGSLTYLDIRNNSLRTLDKDVLEFLSNRSGLIQIYLSGNPWLCNCEYENLMSFVMNDKNWIEDRIDIICIDGNLGRMIDIPAKCNSHLKDNISTIKLLGIIFGSITIISIYFYYYKNSILMWFYERNLCLNWNKQKEPNDSVVLKNDAFLAFAHQDLDLVEEYVEKLERRPGQGKYKLWFYHRDWLIGESILDCILKSIMDSKRIIILLTENFIGSPWGRFEFRTAIQAISINKYKRLIVILYPGVDINCLDSELKNYLKFNTYLCRDDPQFWRKLRFVMPHKKQSYIKQDEHNL